MSDKTQVEINIPFKTILKIILAVLGLWAVYFFRDLIIVFFTAFILAVIIDPLADFFSRHKIPRAAAVLLIYILLLALIVSIFSLLIPPVFGQIQGFIKDLLGYWEKISAERVGLQSLEIKEIFGNLQESLSAVESGVSRIAGGAYGAVAGFFGNIFKFVLILVLAFYMVIQETELKSFVRFITPGKYRALLDESSREVRLGLTRWLRGQLILMVVIWFLVFVGLLILGVPYALVLSILAGVLEVIPYVGPVLSAVPAVLFGLSISPWTAVFTVILFVIVQRIENDLLVPKVMQKTTGLNPIVILLALVIGGKIAGVLGAILAIPITLCGKILVDIILKKRAELQQS